MSAGRGAPGHDGSPAGRRPSADRWTGALLFLPVPIVLFLFVRLPFGVWSLAGGLVLMMTHPLYARPWALRRSAGRCLWCGRSIGSIGRGVAAGVTKPARLSLEVTDPRGPHPWHFCDTGHRARAASALRRAAMQQRWLRAGVGGSLGIFLAAAAVALLRPSIPFTPRDASAFFQLAVAVTVLRLAAWPARAPAPEKDAGSPGAAAPFPLHLPALIGIDTVFWLFRLIGVIWLVQGVWHFARLGARG